MSSGVPQNWTPYFALQGPSNESFQPHMQGNSFIKDSAWESMQSKAEESVAVACQFLC